MGLDMWVHKIKVLDDQTTSDMIRTNPYSYSDVQYVSESDYFDAKDLYHNIMPIMRRVSLVDSSWDYDLIKRHYNIPESSKQWGFSNHPGGISLTFGDNNRENLQEIDIENYSLLKFTKYDFNDYYVCNREELCYWRKAYNIQNIIYDMYAKLSANVQIILPYLSDSSVPSSSRKLKEVIAQNGISILESEVKEVLDLYSCFGYEYLRTFPDGVHNCGNHILTKRMVSKIDKLDKTTHLLEEYQSLEKDEILVYHEWY